MSISTAIDMDKITISTNASTTYCIGGGAKLAL